MRFLHRPGHSLGLLSFLPTQHAIDGSTSTSPDDRHQDQTQRQQVILESFSRLSAGPVHEEPIRLVDRQRHGHDRTDAQCRNACQRTGDQRQSAERFSGCRQQSKHCGNPHGFGKEAHGARETITAEPTERLLQTMGIG